MRRISRGAAALFAGLVLVTAAVVATAVPADAAGYADQNCANQKTAGACDNVTITYDSNDPCFNGSYAVYGSTGHTVYPVYGDWGWRLEIRYSPNCLSNFAVVSVDAWASTALPEQIAYAAKVRRGSGPDGGYLMYEGPRVTTVELLGSLNGPTQALSPLVWSPDNPAESCISVPAVGGSNWDQYECTGYV